MRTKNKLYGFWFKNKKGIIRESCIGVIVLGMTILPDLMKHTNIFIKYISILFILQAFRILVKNLDYNKGD